MLEHFTVISQCPAEGFSKSLSPALATICLNHLSPPPHASFSFLEGQSSLTVGMLPTQTALSWPQLPCFVLRCQERNRRVTVLMNFCMVLNQGFPKRVTQMEPMAIRPLKSGWGLLLDNTPKKENASPETNTQN